MIIQIATSMNEILDETSFFKHELILKWFILNVVSHDRIYL